MDLYKMGFGIQFVVIFSAILGLQETRHLLIVKDIAVPGKTTA